MSKSKKSARKRSAGRGSARRSVAPQLELLAALREGVEAPTPGPLLALVGLLLASAGADDDPAGSLDHLVRSFSSLQRPEASAALLAIAVVTADPELRRRVRREIADRGHVLPRWLAELDRTRPAGRAVELSTVLRDADELLVGVVVPGGHPLTAVVRIDNGLGAVATDGYVTGEEVESVVGLLADDDPDVRVRDISTADARARITAALHEMEFIPRRLLDSQTWFDSRPVVRWMVSLLPEGGQDYVLQDLSPEQLDEIADHFLAGPAGGSWSSDDLRPLLDEVLAAASANGIGDPLVWSPRSVRRVLGPDLVGWEQSTPHLDRAPDLVRDLVRYGHGERGLRHALTDDALAAVDASATAFVDAVRRAEADED
jgi:hypothetical protein